MTSRDAFIVRTSKRIARPVFEGTRQDFGASLSPQDEGRFLSAINARAQRYADDLLSEDNMQDAIRDWDRTRLVSAIARHLEGRVAESIRHLRHTR